MTDERGRVSLTSASLSASRDSKSASREAVSRDPIAHKFCRKCGARWAGGAALPDTCPECTSRDPIKSLIKRMRIAQVWNAEPEQFRRWIEGYADELEAALLRSERSRPADKEEEKAVARVDSLRVSDQQATGGKD